jgi:SAM-dependent methyltransferase
MRRPTSHGTMTDLFGSAAMVAGYARSRPAIHPRVVERARLHLGPGPFDRAVDVGCGAGLSTLALAGLAGVCVGVEPVVAMLAASPLQRDAVRFAAARAEALPVREHTIDLVTAAGSLNFADLAPSLAEVHRVLRPGGRLLVYDFSAGRSFRASPALDAWFTEFRHRYPIPLGVARPLDPSTLAAAADGFELLGAETFAIGLELGADFYCDYVMTGTNVAHAVDRGEAAASIRAWCAASLAPVFAGVAHEVVFPGYLAVLAPAS